MKNLDYEQFMGSFSYDQRLAAADITGSIAHTKMLVKTKIIKASEGSKIIVGLNLILKDLNKGWKLPKEEDIHYAVEKELIRRIGAVGGKMHTARSRNDQVATDIRIYLKAEVKHICEFITSLQKTLVKKAEENIDVIMPGWTHLQPAQPILASHNLLAYVQMFQRDKERFCDCLKRIDILPLGSAALAGTSFKIDRMFSAKLLGFASVSENSLDSVSDRDFAAEFLFCCSLTSIHLTRFCEEIILWMNPEFGYITIDDKFTSGSSIMPQKKNPDCAEVVRGKSGRILGNLIALLTITKSLPLSYNRDLQEDKPPVFDSLDNVEMCLKILDDMVKTLKFNKEKTLESAQKGFMEATEIADYLARRNIPFRTAHGIVKQIVLYCLNNNKTLNQLSMEQFQKFSKFFEKDLFKHLNLKNIISAKNSFGGTSKTAVLKQIKNIKQKLI